MTKTTGTIAEKIKAVIYSYKIGEVDEITILEKIEDILKNGNCICEFLEYCITYNANNHCNSECANRMKEYFFIK